MQRASASCVVPMSILAHFISEAQMRSRPLLRPTDRRAARQRDAWVAFEDRAARRDASSPDTAPRLRDQDLRWILSYQRGEIVALVQRVSELEGQRRRRSLMLAIVAVAMAGAGLAAYGPPESLTTRDDQPVAQPTPMAVVIPGAPTASEPPVPLPSPQESSHTTPAASALPAAKAAPTPLDSLPVQAPVHVTVNFPPGDKDVEQLALILVRHLRERGLAADDPAPGPPATRTGITYYYAEDRDGALMVERILGGLMGSRLLAGNDGDPLPRPGSVLVTMAASKES